MVKKIIKTRPLVLGHLERISVKAFSDFRKQLTDLVGTKHGIYALYKGDRLYYQGQLYNSPSLAGRAAVGRMTNGWHLWKYQNQDGDWVWLDELRKK